MMPPFDSVLKLPALSLEQLQTEAAFLTRVDRKYIVPDEALEELLVSIEGGTRVLQIGGRRSFGYSTRYFDDEHTAYFRALRHRANRFKVRTRLYDESGECVLEVKAPDGRGRTAKFRIAHDPERLESLMPLDRAWLLSFAAVRSSAGRLDRSVGTHYFRSALVFPAGVGRLSIDRELTFIAPHGSRLRLEGYCVVETKGTRQPLSFDRLLWRAGFRPVPVSKFALGVCLAFPDLPDNRWRRLRATLAPSILEVDA